MRHGKPRQPGNLKLSTALSMQLLLAAVGPAAYVYASLTNDARARAARGDSEA